MAPNLVGWESLYKTAESQIKNKNDFLVAFVHWNLVSNNMKCLGIGEDMEFNEEDAGSELLPADWNESKKYSLRYIHHKRLYLFFATFLGGRAIFSLLSKDDSKLFSYTIDIEDEVKSTSDKLSESLPNYEKLIYQLKKDLLEAIDNKKSSDASMQTEEDASQSSRRQVVIPPLGHDPLRVYPDNSGRPGGFLPPYGRGDLVPEYGYDIGGGALFEPRLPRLGGNRVPHRYDPIGPVGPRDPFAAPNPDHLRPPGYDDMYM